MHKWSRSSTKSCMRENALCLPKQGATAPLLYSLPNSPVLMSAAKYYRAAKVAIHGAKVYMHVFCYAYVGHK